MMLWGGILFVAAAFNLVAGIATDAIPAKWPFKPKSREEYPEAFRTFVCGWSALAVVGAILILIGLARG